MDTVQVFCEISSIIVLLLLIMFFSCPANLLRISCEICSGLLLEGDGGIYACILFSRLYNL